MSAQPQIDPDRLIAAADALLAAYRDIAAAEQDASDDAASHNSGSLCEFEVQEIEEAARFLVRLGMLEARFESSDGNNPG